MKAIFDTKPTSIYDDRVSQHYHFPQRYSDSVEQCVGDWVILRRPRADGGNLAYFATAKISHVEPDPTAPTMSYARFMNYIEFDEPVPWRQNQRYAEEMLRNIPKTQVGIYLRGRSVRLISEADFVALLGAGLKETLDPQNAARFGLPTEPIVEAAQAIHQAGNEPHGERVWRIEQALTNRIVRDANFRRSVCGSYDSRCAITRLRIIDGAGRAEVQAVHIWAVAEGGPDIVQNALALSGTVHWLFDRYLIALTDDFRVLVAKDGVPEDLRELFVPEGKQIHLPADRSRWPHPAYIGKHRSVFLGKNTA